MNTDLRKRRRDTDTTMSVADKEYRMGINSELYEHDFFQWTQTTAALIRQGKWHEVDPESVAEELESLGKRDWRELRHRLDGLLMHLLKWRYQPSMRQTGHSWRLTIREHRRQLIVLLEDSPSLRPRVPTVVPNSYANARIDASDETGLPLATFPTACPWTVDQILDESFWPEGEQEA